MNAPGEVRFHRRSFENVALNTRSPPGAIILTFHVERGHGGRRRSEVKDAHDRYDKIAAGYLSQRMDEYGGVTILATHLQKNMDAAFIERFNIVVQFPFPDESERRRIWSMIFPREAPLAPGVDFDRLAGEIALPAAGSATSPFPPRFRRRAATTSSAWAN